jgi:membrane-bound lytic murein transglycosylase D
MRALLLVALASVVTLSTPSAGSADTERECPVPNVVTSQPLRTEVETLRTRVERLEGELAASQSTRHIYPSPDAMEFAGESVPLDRWDVRERLERELLLSLGNPGQVLLWLKRSTRYFPYIEDELKKAHLPEDLKYVAVIESALIPTAQSPASALGIWQFIPATARRYGLVVTSSWDERRSPEPATAAALSYLRDLYARFGRWPLALAAYNAGESRIEQALRQQGVPSYYQLALPTETERYVFRALAAKLVLSEPERYGFQIPAEQLYRPHQTDVVVVQVRDRVLIADLAKAAGSFYRELRELNPAILEESLPRGQYALRIPKERGSGFAAAVGLFQQRPRRESPLRVGSIHVPLRELATCTSAPAGACR